MRGVYCDVGDVGAEGQGEGLEVFWEGGPAGFEETGGSFRDGDSIRVAVRDEGWRLEVEMDDQGLRSGGAWQADAPGSACQ